MTVHLEVGLHISHCCSQHGCKYDDEQCPVFFGRVKQEGPCVECRRRGSGPFKEVDPFGDNRKTPIPAPIAHLTPEQMMDLLIDMLDTREVQERITEAVIDVLREKLMSIAEERRRGSYIVLNPDVDDDTQG